ncbi:MAG: isoaspartyl peptidase/L-asparaginase [Candidatus Thermoplasmatota archaeon]|nr:isoaspartyl peptidase/L-asparaginase [Candidatus Thermoplasmatota archaeon]
MVALAIHGGAGGDGPWKGPTDLDPDRIACMQNVLSTVGSMLESGITALEAVTIAVEMLEDEPLFNAGKGSVIAANGNITMDASIMDGKDGRVGSVVNVQKVRHPIRAAKTVLDNEWPVMLNSDAADKYAIEHGLEEVSQEWLKTELRIAQWQKWKDANSRPGSTDEDDEAVLDHDIGMGTVGAVALDKNGNLAAATSTGGMTGKPAGRIGDTPIIGAGTWADNHVAVSCTGVGEAFIRACAAHEVSTRVRMGESLTNACCNMLEMVAPIGGRGGVIAVDSNGNIEVPFQTMLMYRGIWKDGEIMTGIGPDLLLE